MRDEKSELKAEIEEVGRILVSYWSTTSLRSRLLMGQLHSNIGSIMRFGASILLFGLQFELFGVDFDAI